MLPLHPADSLEQQDRSLASEVQVQVEASAPQHQTKASVQPPGHSALGLSTLFPPPTPSLASQVPPSELQRLPVPLALRKPSALLRILQDMGNRTQQLDLGVREGSASLGGLGVTQRSGGLGGLLGRILGLARLLVHLPALELQPGQLAPSDLPQAGMASQGQTLQPSEVLQSVTPLSVLLLLVGCLELGLWATLHLVLGLLRLNHLVEPGRLALLPQALWDLQEATLLC